MSNDSETHVDTGECYENERGEFKPGPVPDRAQSLSKSVRKLEYNPDRPGSWKSEYPSDRVERKRDALEKAADAEAMPLEAEKTEVEFLVRDVSERTGTRSFTDAKEIVDDPFADEPDEFTDTEVTHTVSEEVIECHRCDGSGDGCNNCSGKGCITCPNRNCYGGVIETDCDQCGGTGEYYPYKNSNTKEECNKCNYHNRVKQGQCNTCGGNPPVGKTGYIECDECGGDGVGDDCNRCNGRGELKRQTDKEITYSTATKECVRGHQCAKDKGNVEWEQTDSEVLDDVDAIEDLPVTSPDDSVVQARVTKYDAHMYEGRVQIAGEEIRFIQSRSGSNLSCTHKHVQVSESSLGGNILTSAFLGGSIGIALTLLIGQFPFLYPDIPGVTVTPTMVIIAPMIILFLYYQVITSKYTFTPKKSYD